MELSKSYYAYQWFILVVAASVAQASVQLHSTTTSWSPSSGNSLLSQRSKEFSGTRKLLDAAQYPNRDVVTVVRSPEDLKAALDNNATHIEIQAHMNLADWYWNGIFSDWSILEISGTLRSITGNCTAEPQSSEMLPIDSLQPPLGPRMQGQCVILFGDSALAGGHQVDMHILEDSNAPPLWMHNLMLRRTGSNLQYTFVRADRSFYMTGIALLGDGQLGPQALRIMDGAQALVADSVIADWVEENSSIVVTESPLSLQGCTFQNNTAGTGKAIVESWYGAVVRLERVKFKGSSGVPLLNDDPAINSEESGVFYAPSAGALPVNTTGSGERRTRPLSAAPDAFLTPLDGQFVALQQEVQLHERHSAEGVVMYVPAGVSNADAPTAVGGPLRTSAIAGIVLTAILVVVVGAAVILAIYCICPRQGKSRWSGFKRSNSVRALQKVSRGGYSGSSRAHVRSSHAIHSGNNSTVSSHQPKLTHIAEHTTAPDYFPMPKIATAKSGSQPLQMAADNVRAPMHPVRSPSDDSDHPTGSSSSSVQSSLDQAQAQQPAVESSSPRPHSSPGMSSELEPLPSSPQAEHSTNPDTHKSSRAPSSTPSKHAKMSDIDEDVSPRLPMPPGHACGKLHMCAHDSQHQRAARKGGVQLDHALESVITEIVCAQKNNSALVNSRSTQSDAATVGGGPASLERFYSAGSDERSPSSPTTSGSDRTGAAVTVASAVAAATSACTPAAVPAVSASPPGADSHMHGSPRSRMHVAQPPEDLPSSQQYVAKSQQSLQRIHWQSVQRMQNAQGSGNRNTPSPSRDGEISPWDSPFDSSGYRGLHPPSAHEAAPHAGTQHFEGHYMGVPDTPSASSLAESVQSAPPASPRRHLQQHVDEGTPMHAGHARDAHAAQDAARQQRGRDRQPRQSSPHGLHPFKAPSPPPQHQELDDGSPPYVCAQPQQDRRRASSPGVQRHVHSHPLVASDARPESSSSAALPLMYARPRQSSPGAPAYMHAQDRRPSSPAAQRYMHAQDGRSSSPAAQRYMHEAPNQHFVSPYPYPGHRQPPQPPRQPAPPTFAPGEYFTQPAPRPAQPQPQYRPFDHHAPPQVFAAPPPPWMQPIVQRPAVFLGPRQRSTPSPFMQGPPPLPNVSMMAPLPPPHHMRRYSVPVHMMPPPAPARRPAVRPALVATQRPPVATSATTAAVCRPMHPSPPADAPRANKPPAGVSSSVGAHAGAPSDTKDSISDLATARVPMSAPSIDAPLDAFKSHLHRQLDSLVGKQVLGSLKVLGGPKNRIEGQAVVQLVEDTRNHTKYAMKCFLSDKAFQQEKELYSDSRHALGRMLPQLHRIVDASEAAVKDGYGSPLPPCIVMEKGEALDVWVQRYRDHIDLVKGLQVLAHVAERLRYLHKSGYVHRDLKPANVMWLSIQKRWTIIDFACAVATGSPAPPGFSLHYAAPEALRARIGGDEDFVASEALDCWSLGVLALELFSGIPVFERLQPREQTISMILGERMAPWEDPEMAPELLRPLGSFKKVVLGLLKRDPLQRTTVTSLQHSCHRMHARLSSRPVT